VQDVLAVDVLDGKYSLRVAGFSHGDGALLCTLGSEAVTICCVKYNGGCCRRRLVDATGCARVWWTTETTEASWAALHRCQPYLHEPVEYLRLRQGRLSCPQVTAGHNCRADNKGQQLTQTHIGIFCGCDSPIPARLLVHNCHAGHCLGNKWGLCPGRCAPPPPFPCITCTGLQLHSSQSQYTGAPCT
jgi:hypothetical protein